MEREYGITPDISMFRFGFWEAVWYYEPTAKYPQPNFLPARHIGIAWHHGDAFTYVVWTCPDNMWEEGQKLIRNVVRARKCNECQPVVDYDESSLLLTKRELSSSQRKVARRRDRKKRKRSNEDEDEHPRNHTVRFDDSPQIITDSNDSEENGAIEAHGVNTGQDNENTTTNTTTTAKTTPKQNLGNNHYYSDDETSVESSTDETEMEFDPTADQSDIEMQEEVNNQLSGTLNGSTTEPTTAKIVGHKWKEGRLVLSILQDGMGVTEEELPNLKEDYPRITAEYIIKNVQSRSESDRPDRTLAWAKKTLRDMDRSIRRLCRLFDFEIDDNNRIVLVRRTGINKKKKKKYKPPPRYKYGIEVPRTVEEADNIDRQNGNELWKEATNSEVGTLVDMDCFEFHERGYDPGDGYQKTKLMLIFTVKQDLRRKVRLVAGGHLIDALDHDIYSSTVKGVSVKLLQVIAHSASLDILCGDIGNAYVNAYTNEQVYAYAGSEFGAKEGYVIIIKKALYGLKTSGERWHAHLADTLRSIGFVPTRYDKDVWIRYNAEGGESYEYISTYVDDLMIVSRHPHQVMNVIKEIYIVKSIGPLSYYLGNDYKKDKQGRWCVGCKKYIMEATKRVESMFGALKKFTHPAETGDHPELDESPVLSEDMHRKFQMLIGMLVWINVLGRADIAHVTTSLSRFTACPREGHLERVLRVFGFLKKRSNRRFKIDSSEPIIEGGQEALDRDFVEEFKNNYPEASEEIDAKLPVPLFDEIAITVFVDSDHGHDKITRRSISGIIIFVGRTPVFFSSKRQGAIETSTYGAEFCAMKSGVEETFSIRYMLRALGVKVEHASMICGDSMSVIHNVTESDSLLKKKHVAISYHKTREAAAAGVVHPVKVSGEHNYADLMTKSQALKCFNYLSNGFMWG